MGRRARFSVPLEALARRMELDVETVARKATFQVFTGVVLRSPVDTGRFRANWNVSVQSPNLQTTVSTQQARAQAEVSKALALPVGGVTYLANGLPYGPQLEYGSSKQAPTGMVRITAQEFDAYVRKAIAS